MIFCTRRRCSAESGADVSSSGVSCVFWSYAIGVAMKGDSWRLCGVGQSRVSSKVSMYVRMSMHTRRPRKSHWTLMPAILSLAILVWI